MSANYPNFEPEPVLAALHAGETNQWQLEKVSARVWRGHHRDFDFSDIAIKQYPERAPAEREFMVLNALRDFGMNLAPEPIYHHDDENAPLLIMSWLEGEPIPQAPASRDEEHWHQLMAAIGASSILKFEDYQLQVPPQGMGIRQPEDLMNRIDTAFQTVDNNHPDYDRLTTLMANMRERTPAEWAVDIEPGLIHGDVALHNFLQDGCCHVLVMDWEQADWGDIAAEVGLWSAHPDFENVPSTHWVWVRWEFARLINDGQVVPRATVYSNLAQVYWAVRLTASNSDQDLRARYLQRAAKLFGM